MTVPVAGVCGRVVVLMVRGVSCSGRQSAGGVVVFRIVCVFWVFRRIEGSGGVCGLW